MAIETVDGIIKALGGNFTRFIIEKNNLGSQATGRLTSLWRGASLPASGALPTTPVLLNSTTLGAIPFTNQTPPMKAYIGYADYVNSVAGNALILGDRLAHQGGLVFNVITSQTTNLPLNLETLAASADRIGAVDYSEIQWYLETYTDGGATASNATINVTYNDNTTADLAVVAVGGTVRASHLIPLNPFTANGKFIKGINSVILSASTGTAGSFGFTAVRELTSMNSDMAYKRDNFDWARLGLPVVPNDACVVPMVVPTGSGSGLIKSLGKIIYG